MDTDLPHAIDEGEPSARPIDAALAAAFERRRTTIAARHLQLAVIGRLSPLIDGHADAASALTTFEAQEAEAVRIWASASSDEPPPSSDTGRHAELAEALRAAEQRAAAARTAREAAEAEIVRLNGAVAPLNAAIAAAAVPVLAAEVDPIIARTRANIAQLEVDLGDLAGITSALLSEADRAKASGSPFAAEMSSAAVRVVNAVMFANPLMNLVGLPPGAKAKWARFLADLKKEAHHEHE